jgi:hypothetical protein
MFDYHDLARNVDAFGIETCEKDLLTLANLAARADVSPTLISVMLDAEQPDVARVRALARVQAEMGRRTPTLIAA